MRKMIIAGNWKMNKTPAEAVKLVGEIKQQLKDVSDVTAVVCPPFIDLTATADVLRGSSIGLGAQNMYWEESGAFTGEISPLMLKDANVTYVIIGHSERRQYFQETEETVNKRLRSALDHGLTPIVCVGEHLEQREQGKAFDVIRTQCEGGLKGLTPEDAVKIVVAYEPVWAIGTGKTATPNQAQEVHKFIRELLEEQFGSDAAAQIRIQYGGSVKPENTAELMSQPDIDGALVGGASLKADSFVQIVRNSSGVAAK